MKKILCVIREVVWPVEYSTSYKIICIVTCIVSAYSIVLDLWASNYLGQGQDALGWPLVHISVFLTMVCWFAWKWILERMAIKKVEYMTKRIQELEAQLAIMKVKHGGKKK